jgi:hypothetical protein
VRVGFSVGVRVAVGPTAVGKSVAVVSGPRAAGGSVTVLVAGAAVVARVGDGMDVGTAVHSGGRVGNVTGVGVGPCRFAGVSAPGNTGGLRGLSGFCGLANVRLTHIQARIVRPSRTTVSTFHRRAKALMLLVP